MYRKILQNLVIVFFTTISIFLFLNFIIFFFSSFISQKYFSKQFLNLLPIEATYYYADIFKTLETYDLILGDSHVFGNGNSYLDDDYNYSIGHHLYNLSRKKNNFVNIGFPGGGSQAIYNNFINSQKKIKSNPKKIIYIFYEGNDLENNIFYEKNFNKTTNFKQTIRYYFPLIIFTRNSIRHFKSFFKKNKKVSNKKIPKNKYKVNNKIKVLETYLQSPPKELDEIELNHALEILFKSLIDLKKICENLTIVYVPSPTTVMDLTDPIYIQEYFNNKVNNPIKKDELDFLSELLRDKIKIFSKKNELIFIDTTNRLKNASKFQKIYGPKDFKHPNKIGYQLIAETIHENIYKKTSNN